MRRIAVLVLALSVVAAACSDDDDTTSSVDTSSTLPTDQTTTTVATDELPGEAVDIFPYEGAIVGVVGVAAGDTLGLRAGPGTDYATVAELEPLHEGSTATGRNRSIDSVLWVELRTPDDLIGWAEATRLLQPGVVTDVTTALYPTPADLPSAETMEALAAEVAVAVASTDPASTVTIVDGPTVGDLAEVIVDVIGLGDDAAGGLRLRLFAEPDADGAEFTLRTIEQTELCSRGVSEGLCV